MNSTPLIPLIRDLEKQEFLRDQVWVVSYVKTSHVSCHLGIACCAYIQWSERPKDVNAHIFLAMLKICWTRNCGWGNQLNHSFFWNCGWWISNLRNTEKWRFKKTYDEIEVHGGDDSHGFKGVVLAFGRAHHHAWSIEVYRLCWKKHKK